MVKLTDHDNAGSLSRAANAWDSEQFNEASEKITFHRNSGLLDENLLLLKLRMDVVELTGGLKWRVPQSQQ